MNDDERDDLISTDPRAHRNAPVDSDSDGGSSGERIHAEELRRSTSRPSVDAGSAVDTEAAEIGGPVDVAVEVDESGGRPTVALETGETRDSFVELARLGPLEPGTVHLKHLGEHQVLRFVRWRLVRGTARGIRCVFSCSPNPDRAASAAE